MCVCLRRIVQVLPVAMWQSVSICVGVDVCDGCVRYRKEGELGRCECSVTWA